MADQAKIKVFWYFIMEGGLWESSRFFGDLLSVSGDFLGDVVKVVGLWVVEPV